MNKLFFGASLALLIASPSFSQSMNVEMVKNNAESLLRSQIKMVKDGTRNLTSDPARVRLGHVCSSLGNSIAQFKLLKDLVGGEVAEKEYAEELEDIYEGNLRYCDIKENEIAILFLND